MTMPTVNRGLQTAALAQVQWAVRLLERALPMIGSASEPGKDIMKAITALGKHVPPGASSPGVEQSSLQQMMMQQRQEQPEIARMRAMGGGTAPGQPSPSPAPPPQAAA